MEPKHSLLGIASFVISLMVGFFMMAIFIAAGVLNHGHPARNHASPAQTVLGLVILALLGADIVAAVLGFMSLFQPDRKRLFGILGAVFSVMTLLAVVGTIVIGLLLLHRATS